MKKFALILAIGLLAFGCDDDDDNTSAADSGVAGQGGSGEAGQGGSGEAGQGGSGEAGQGGSGEAGQGGSGEAGEGGSGEAGQGGSSVEIAVACGDGFCNGDETIESCPSDCYESCEALNAADCTVNSECADDEVCHTVNDDWSISCCVKGARGTAQVGDDCGSAADKQLFCASSMCIEGEISVDGDRVEVAMCTDYCQGDDSVTCPDDMYCHAFLGFCIPGSGAHK